MQPFEPNQKSEARRFGLDLLRALAVLSVVYGHFTCSVNLPYWFVRFGRGALIGVEVFFVLSGFLIGGLLIQLMVSGRFRTGQDLFHFLGRRWLRTLPLYYLFLVLYYLNEFRSFDKVPEHLKFVFFLQNFAWSGPVFYRLAWSLSVEEYFYLFFPLLCLGLLRSSIKPRTALLTSVGVFLVVPFIFRGLAPVQLTWDDFDWSFRQVVVLRLDSLMYGVGAAAIFKFYPAAWARVRRWSAVGFLLIAAQALYIYFDFPGLLGSRWQQLFVFPISSLSFALVLPYFYDMKRPALPRFAAAITSLSTISYSLYLSHVLVIFVIKQELSRTAGGRAFIDQPFLFVPLLMAVALPAAYLVHYGWESPFLSLRDHWLPTHRRARVSAPFLAEAAA